MNNKKVVYADSTKIADCLKILADQISNVGEIELTEDYYWKLDEDETYNVEDSPNVTAIGSLHDDYNSLERVLNRDDIYLSSVDIDRLASLLKFIGYQISK